MGACAYATMVANATQRVNAAMQCNRALVGCIACLILAVSLIGQKKGRAHNCRPSCSHTSQLIGTQRFVSLLICVCPRLHLDIKSLFFGTAAMLAAVCFALVGEARTPGTIVDTFFSHRPIPARMCFVWGGGSWCLLEEHTSQS